MVVARRDIPDGHTTALDGGKFSGFSAWARSARWNGFAAMQPLPHGRGSDLRIVPGFQCHFMPNRYYRIDSACFTASVDRP
jgi:hypothetical protein